MLTREWVFQIRASDVFYISCYTPHKFTSRHLISSGHGCLEKAMLSYRFRARHAVSFLQSELTNSAVRYVLHICHISLVLLVFFSSSTSLAACSQRESTRKISVSFFWNIIVRFVSCVPNVCGLVFCWKQVPFVTFQIAELCRCTMFQILFLY